MAGPTIENLFDAIVSLEAGTVSSIVERQPELVQVVENGETALSIATLMATSDLAIPSTDGGEAAHEIVAVLLAAGADVSHRSGNGWSPLHGAACAGNTRLVSTLLAVGGDPAATVGATEGSTPIAFALFYAHRETGRIIDAAGRRPDDLRCAAALDDVTGIDRWLDADGALRPGGDAGMPFSAPLDAFGPRPGPITDRLTIDESLSWAARNGSLHAMATLIDRGANVDANPFRGTPLLWAIYSDQDGAAQLLIDAGADVDLRHDFGGLEHGRSATALHLAAQYRCERSLGVLLDAGADRSIRDAAYDATPADWAEHAGNHDLAERLRV